MIEALPVEIWRQFVLFIEIIDEFYFSCASKLTFEICYGNKKFKDKKRISKHFISFYFENFNFFKSELEVLSKSIKKC